MGALSKLLDFHGTLCSIIQALCVALTALHMYDLSEYSVLRTDTLKADCPFITESADLTMYVHT